MTQNITARQSRAKRKRLIRAAVRVCLLGIAAVDAWIARSLEPRDPEGEYRAQTRGVIGLLVLILIVVTIEWVNTAVQVSTHLTTAAFLK